MFGGAHKDFNHLDNWNLQLLHTKLVNIDKIMGALAPTTVLLASPLPPPTPKKKKKTIIVVYLSSVFFHTSIMTSHLNFYFCVSMFRVVVKVFSA